MSDDINESMAAFGSQINAPTPDNDDPNSLVEIKVVGVGGGGNNAINHMYRQGVQNVTFVVVNTDKQSLRTSPVPNKVQLGPGLGAGNRPEVGRDWAEKDIAKIEALFEDDTKMVFITAGMGGGTGTGAGPVVARVAKERGLLTVGIVTIPFLFEGEKKILKALDGADEMGRYVDALLVINNERLTEIYGDLDFLNAYAKADDILSTAARSISDIITIDGVMNLDFNDVDTTLRNGGAAIISSGYGEGENRVTKAIEDALNSPLLKNRDVFGSRRMLFNIYFSSQAKDSFRMSEVNELTDFVGNINPDVDVIWGTAIDDSLGESIKITLLTAGFDVTIRDEEDQIRNNRVNKSDSSSSSDTRRDAQAPSTQTPAAAAGAQRSYTPAEPADQRSAHSRIGEAYGQRAVEARSTHVVLQPSQYDDDEVIDKIESHATYNRDKHIVDELKSASTAQSGEQQQTTRTSGSAISFD